jgi:hypothetical protein
LLGFGVASSAFGCHRGPDAFAIRVKRHLGIVLVMHRALSGGC